MFQAIQTLIQCGTLLTVAFLVLLAMPQSKLREFLMPVIGWGFALFCGAYVLMPVDIIPEILAGPFGLIDDAGAVVAGIASARAAMNAKANRTISRN